MFKKSLTLLGGLLLIASLAESVKADVEVEIDRQGRLVLIEDTSDFSLPNDIVIRETVWGNGVFVQGINGTLLNESFTQLFFGYNEFEGIDAWFGRGDITFEGLTEMSGDISVVGPVDVKFVDCVSRNMGDLFLNAAGEITMEYSYFFDHVLVVEARSFRARGAVFARRLTIRPVGRVVIEANSAVSEYCYIDSCPDIRLQDTIFGGNVNIRGTAGGDDLVIREATFQLNCAISTYGGGDDVTIRDTRFENSCSVYTGSGNDDVYLNNLFSFSDRASMKVYLGNGNDWVDLANYQLRTIYLSGGGRYDRYKDDTVKDRGGNRMRLNGYNTYRIRIK